MLTVEKVKELAKQNYNKGGDTIVECYEDYQIEGLISSGIDTEEKLLEWFKQQYEIDEEYRKAANWMAYGTTDEEELERIHREERIAEKPVTENFEFDPCYGCAASSRYNCKHCPHGDDGCYESPLDVYTPAELGICVKW